MCRTGSKEAQWEQNALLKPHLGTVGELFYVHKDDINTCAPNQQDYTLGLSSGWRKRLRVRICEGEKKERRRDYTAFMYLWQLYFQQCDRTVCEPLYVLMKIGGLTEQDEKKQKHPDSEGEG